MLAVNPRLLKLGKQAWPTKKNPAGLWGLEGSRHKRQPEFRWKK